MAARFRIIILEKLTDSPLVYRYAMWADVPVARQPFYAKPPATVSAWKNATGPDSAALVAGEVEERIDTLQVPPGTGVGAIQNHLEASWQAFQAEITGANNWNRYGTVFNQNGTWTGAGVA